MKWTDDEIQFLKASHKYMKYKDIGKILGRSLRSVSSKAWGLKLKSSCNICLESDNIENLKKYTYKKTGISVLLCRDHYYFQLREDRGEIPC
jgi:hypothetical protein